MSKQLQPIQQCERFITNLEADFIKLTNETDSTLRFKQEALFAIQHLQNGKGGEFLTKTAMNNPVSLKNAVLNVASIGLTLNPIEKKAYLIPRNGSVCLDISYIGLADVAVSTGMVLFVNSKVVHENDTFEYIGTESEPIHKFDPFRERGEKIGVYCTVKTHDGSYLSEMMSYQECMEIKNRSEAGKKGFGPWLSDESEMMKKTVVKRASKLWPRNNKSKRLDDAINALNEHEGIDFEKEREEQELLKREAYEKKVKEGQEETEKKYVTIDNIKSLCDKLTQGKEVSEKGIFLKETLNANSFKELHRKSISELERIESNLMDLSC